MPRRRFSRGYSRSRRRYGSKGGSLTGGTGDVNPQWFNLSTLTDPATGTAITASLSVESIVPLQQQALMASRGSKSMVMELLAVQFSKSVSGVSTNTGRLAVTTRSVTAANECEVNKPHVIASASFRDPADSFYRSTGESPLHIKYLLKGRIDLTDQVSSLAILPMSFPLSRMLT